MNMNAEKILYKDLSYRIVGLAMQVHRELGFGFSEKVYESAMMLLLRQEGITALQQAPISVCFRGEVVGDYYADIVIEDKIILELESVDRIIDAHRSQVLNYLKATGFQLAIILNFSKKALEHERLAFTRD
ncbi:MAG TPA: GxxExxY protein [Nitrospiraceae bacterium]|nr:GxxExxY protein [Nitrospiraceae bacterium]